MEDAFHFFFGCELIQNCWSNAELCSIVHGRRVGFHSFANITHNIYAKEVRTTTSVDVMFFSIGESVLRHTASKATFNDLFQHELVGNEQY
jgi:hypothetical protein